MSARRFTARQRATPAEALSELEDTVVAWGGEVQAAQSREDADASVLIQLPVRAGLRYGWVAGAVRATAAEDGVAELELTVDDEEYRVDKAAFGVLLLAAAGALVTLAAPLVPRLVSLVPVGIMLAVGAWLFIVARLRNSGPEELFDLLDEVSGEATGEGAGDDAARDPAR